MREHAFRFGTALDAVHLVDETESGDEYCEHVVDLFNTAVLGNHHKWRFFEEERETADAATDWIVEQGLDLRGHVCLWANVSAWAVPPDVVSAMGVEWEENGVTDPDPDPGYVRERSMDHIEDVITHYGDDVHEWEIVNEVVHETGMIEAIDGEDVDPVEAPILAEWYQQARDVAPAGTTLAVNEYNTLVGPYEGTRTDYERQIAFLADQDAGLDSVGLQSHFSRGETLTPDQILTALDRYAAHDVRLRITEFDMSDPDWDDDDQAAFFHQFLKTVFSHEAVDDFVMWGIYDPLHWQDDAPLFDEEWNEKPAYDVYTDLVFEEWWTDETGETGGDGTYTTTAFEGEYDVTVTRGDDLEETTSVTVSDDTTVELSLDLDSDGSDTDDEDENGDGAPGFGVVPGLAGLAGYALSKGDEDAGN